MTRQEIEQKMDELAREYHDTHDPEIPEEVYRLAKATYGLLHKLFSGNQPLANQELRQCVGLCEA